ncbi:MAG: Hsp20/alpha crystallin family protein [Nitrosotalea sp.]
MIDLDALLRDLNDLLLSTTASNGMKNTKPFTNSARMMGFDVSSNVVVKTLDDLLGSQHGNKSYTAEEKVPLIDVFDREDEIRVVVFLPGIMREDVRFEIGSNSILIEITKGYQIYRKEVSCNIHPSEILAKSTSYNNSTLEIIFRKK